MRYLPALLWALLFLPQSLIWGQARLLGPIPYLTAADSPFDLSGLGSTFFIDDLEDGTLRYPSLVYVDGATVRGPGQLTDSVDGDDGQIDGSGTGGHSLIVTGGLVTFPTFPPTYQSRLTFVLGLGSGHNALGFVWTDALPQHDLHITVTYANSQTETYYLGFDQSFMDASNSGETGEDRFIGLISDRPIRFVELVSRTQGFGPPSERFEFDHIQFGSQPIPEPSYFPRTLLIVGLVLVAMCRQWKSKGVLV